MDEAMAEAHTAKCVLSEGVQLVLERMKTNPEEFESEVGAGKWGNMLSVIHERTFATQTLGRVRQTTEPWLSDAEVEALWRGYVKVQQAKFHRFVMKNILDEPSKEVAQTVHVQQFNNGVLQPGSFTVVNKIGSMPYYVTATSEL